MSMMRLAIALHLCKWIIYFFVLLLCLRAIPYQRDDENFVIG
jgi:hypothetical protein